MSQPGDVETNSLNWYHTKYMEGVGRMYVLIIDDWEI